MATYTPPPYFPQSSLSPPDKKRYRKFKLVISLIVVTVLIGVAGIGFGIWYLLRAIF